MLRSTLRSARRHGCRPWPRNLSIDARTGRQGGALLVEGDWLSSKHSMGTHPRFRCPRACQLGHADRRGDGGERCGNGSSGGAMRMRRRAGGGAHQARRRPNHRVCARAKEVSPASMSGLLVVSFSSPLPVVAIALGPAGSPPLSLVSELFSARAGTPSPTTAPSDIDLPLLAFSLSSAACSRRRGKASGAPIGLEGGEEREGRVDDGLRTMMLGWGAVRGSACCCCCCSDEAEFEQATMACSVGLHVSAVARRRRVEGGGLELTSSREQGYIWCS